MSVAGHRRDRRPISIRLVLVLLIIWDAVALLAELTYGGFLFKPSDSGEVGGFLAARGAFNGAAIVPLTLYVYALVRGPMRYRGLIWVGVLEQGVGALAAFYHLILDDVEPVGAIPTFAISVALLVLLLTNMPKSSETG
jgi:hypothetical protein